MRHDLHQDSFQSEKLVVCMTDVTEQHENERKLHHQANTDALTGLANRHTLHQVLPELLYNATWNHTSAAVLFIDLDQFKAINDSVGHSVGDSAQSLLRQADLAMYRVKRNGRGGTAVFQLEIETEALRRTLVEQHLQEAVSRGELTLVYQPLVALSRGQITSCKALLRWNSAELGLVSPAEFIPIAEQSGLIYGLDEWVILEACKQAARWREETGHRQ